MNELVDARQLLRLIASHSETDPVFVHIFLESMVAIIKEAVNRGEEVTIEGLGTFRPVWVEKGSRCRLAFIPEDHFKEGINAPFAQFEPFQLVPPRKVELETELKVSELVNTEKAETAVAAELHNLNVMAMKEYPENSAEDSRSQMNEEKEAQKYREEMAEVEGPVQVSDGNGDLTEKVDQAIEEDVAPAIDANCKDGSCLTSSRLSLRGMGLWFVIILLAVCVIGGMLYFFLRVDGAEKRVSSLERPVATELSSNTISEQKEAETVQPQAAPAATSEEGTPTTAAATSEEGAPTTAAATSEEGAPTTTAVTSEEGAPTTTAVTSEEGTPTTTAVTSDSVQPVVTSTKVASVSEKTTVSAATSKNSNEPLATVTLRSGERLTLLALRYYGNKAFWVYIYEANKKKYPDPNGIPVGAKLVIPSPSRYDIDAASSRSVKRAKEMGAKILGAK